MQQYQCLQMHYAALDTSNLALGLKMELVQKGIPEGLIMIKRVFEGPYWVIWVDYA